MAKERIRHADYALRYVERWTRSAGDVQWRLISQDKILSIYRKDENSRIFHPANPERVFTWLICETRDDKDNAVVYRYKAEHAIVLDLSQNHERNRTGANRYPKRVLYGNRAPFLEVANRRQLQLRIRNADRGSPATARSLLLAIQAWRVRSLSS